MFFLVRFGGKPWNFPGEVWPVDRSRTLWDVENFRRLGRPFHVDAVLAWGAPRAFQNGVPVPLSFAILDTKPVQLHLEPCLKQESREMDFQIPKTDLHVKSLQIFHFWSLGSFSGSIQYDSILHIEKRQDEKIGNPCFLDEAAKQSIKIDGSNSCDPEAAQTCPDWKMMFRISAEHQKLGDFKR